MHSRCIPSGRSSGNGEREPEYCGPNDKPAKSCDTVDHLLIPIRKLSRNLRNHFNPFSSGPLNGFRNGVPVLRKPVGAIQNEGNRNFLAGRLRNPSIVTTTLGILCFVDQVFVSWVVLIHHNASSLQGWINAMFCIGRNQDVTPNVYTRTGTFLERDDRQSIEEMIQNLFALLSRLL